MTVVYLPSLGEITGMNQIGLLEQEQLTNVLSMCFACADYNIVLPWNLLLISREQTSALKDAQEYMEELETF